MEVSGQLFAPAALPPLPQYVFMAWCSVKSTP